MTITRLVSLSAIVLTLVHAVSTVQAAPYYPNPPSKGKFGAKIGIVYSTYLRVDGRSEESKLGVSFGFLIDVPVARRGMTGISADLHDLHIYNKRKKLLDLAIPVKYRFIYEAQRWELRIMGAAGFGYMTIVDKLERTSYLTLKAGIETVFHTSSRYSLLFDGLILGAPIGGNVTYRVTYGPTLLLRAGIVY